MPGTGDHRPLTLPDYAGLRSEVAAESLRRDGPNELRQSRGRHAWTMLWHIVREPMLLLLLAAVAVYLLLGDRQEAIALGVSVLAVIGLTLYQAVRSERALQALRELGSPRANVVRDGRLRTVPARELVVDDLIHLSEGDRVPADACLLQASNLAVDESLLTGESVPVERSGRPGAIGDDADHLRSASLVVRGHGWARVTATGAATEVGRLGVALRDIRPAATPMQRDIRRAVAVFAALGLASAAVVVGLYVHVHGRWLDALLAGITIAIANIPEEFPVVLTVFLALGAWRLARHRALVRRPPAIEALGAVTMLCTDKTGTLTENRMRVAELVDAEGLHAVTPTQAGGTRALLDTADRACPQELHDPMELAIRDAASACAPTDAIAVWTRVREYPLTPERLATIHVYTRTDSTGALPVACKGAPETVAALCALPADARQRVAADTAAMAARGLRVLAVARADHRGTTDDLPDAPETFDFHWLGLLGLADPLRAGVAQAVAECGAAGVRVVMLTGDHPVTAQAIGQQAGLPVAGITSGEDLEELEDAALVQAARSGHVFARVRPQHKLRLVQALVQAGEVVAMTGDGVNDAPALMAAHVGVAMGQRGTDVAREAASIVLLDDNFVTVVRAIRQGRVIYDNIARAVRYILAVHVPITGLALLPLLLGEPLVLLPLHVVFLELIIDPASTLVFEREPASPNVMRRPPRAPSEHLLDRGNLVAGLGQGLAALLAVVTVYLVGRALELPASQLSALTFIALVGSNVGLLFASRWPHAGAKPQDRANPAVWIAAAAALGMLATVVGFDRAAQWFGFTPPPADLVVLALLAPGVTLFLAGALRSAAHRIPLSSEGLQANSRRDDTDH